MYEQVVAVEVAVLKLVGHLCCPVDTIKKPMVTQVPYVENAWVLLRSEAHGHEHQPIPDASPLPYLVRRELTGVVLYSVVLNYIAIRERHQLAIAEPRQTEGYDTKAVARGKILYGVAIADKQATVVIDNPLQSIAKEFFSVVEYDCLHQLSTSIKPDTLYIAQILAPSDYSVEALRHIHDGQCVAGSIALRAKESHIGVISLRIALESNLTNLAKSFVINLIERGQARILQTEHIVIIYSHTLIGLPFPAIKGSKVADRRTGEIHAPARC